MIRCISASRPRRHPPRQFGLLLASPSPFPVSPDCCRYPIPVSYSAHCQPLLGTTLASAKPARAMLEVPPWGSRSSPTGCCQSPASTKGPARTSSPQRALHDSPQGESRGRQGLRMSASVQLNPNDPSAPSKGPVSQYGFATSIGVVCSFHGRWERVDVVEDVVPAWAQIRYISLKTACRSASQTKNPLDEKDQVELRVPDKTEVGSIALQEHDL